MPFTLKKILGTLLSPMAVGMLFLLAALALSFTARFGRLGRGLLAAGLIGAFLLGTEPVANALVAPLEARYPALHHPGRLADEVRWVVVLGGGHESDDDVTPAARLTPEALYRLTEGVRLHHLLPGSTLVLSGYAGLNDRSHARAMLDAALAMGVDLARTHLEPQPRDTGEEAERVAALLAPGERFVLVTSASHMRRAVYHFRARGLDPIPAPAQAYALRRTGPLRLRDVLPAAGRYLKVERAVYEALGLLWARMLLGVPFSVGDGDG